MNTILNFLMLGLTKKNATLKEKLEEYTTKIDIIVNSLVEPYMNDDEKEINKN